MVWVYLLSTVELIIEDLHYPLGAQNMEYNTNQIRQLNSLVQFKRELKKLCEQYTYTHVHRYVYHGIVTMRTYMCMDN